MKTKATATGRLAKLRLMMKIMIKASTESKFSGEVFRRLSFCIRESGESARELLTPSAYSKSQNLKGENLDLSTSRNKRW